MAGAGKSHCQREASGKDEIMARFRREEIGTVPFEPLEDVVRIDPAWLD